MAVPPPPPPQSLIRVGVTVFPYVVCSPSTHTHFVPLYVSILCKRKAVVRIPSLKLQSHCAPVCLGLGFNPRERGWRFGCSD
ncbi:hypothetical protein FKM82_017232 [Ascaphus truei]